MNRLTRAEQNHRNRGLVLDAARRLFLAQGYHGATVDKIAEEAGFSKGVVYSQFDSKADMFLALLDLRIDERAGQNELAAAGLSGGTGLVTLMERLATRQLEDIEWGLLLAEFRVHAARDPELNRRYAAAHERTISGLATVVTAVFVRAGEKPPMAAADLAQVLLALSVGMQLERAAIPGGMSAPVRARVLSRLLTHADAGRDLRKEHR